MRQVSKPRSLPGKKTSEHPSDGAPEPVRPATPLEKHEPVKPRSKRAGAATKHSQIDTEEREFEKALIEVTDAIVVCLDMAGEISFVNRAFVEITGYTREELEGRNWFEALVPRDRYPEVWEEFQRVTAGTIAARFENPFLTKSGEERFIVWRNSDLRNDGTVVGTASIGIDITERKRAEADLADSEQKLLAVFSLAPAGIAVTSAEDGNIYDVNEEFQRIFDCHYDEVVGKTVFELGFWVDESDRARTVREVEEHGRVKDVECRMRKKSGGEMIVNLNTRAVTVQGDNFRHP